MLHRWCRFVGPRQVKDQPSRHRECTEVQDRHEREICEEEGHHADFELSWGRVKVMIWTHKIDGLNESDFILAAKIDKI